MECKGGWGAKYMECKGSWVLNMWMVKGDLGELNMWSVKGAGELDFPLNQVAVNKAVQWYSNFEVAVNKAV